MVGRGLSRRRWCRLIPYFSIPVKYIGPLPLDPWGTAVCIGFVVGLELARARGIKTGLDVRNVVDGIVATIGMGFVVGHLVHVLAYHYEDVFLKQGIISLFKVWEGLSSFGGFLGAAIGAVGFYKFVRKEPFWPYADAIMYGFPFGWVFGRIGCFLAHDHIGRLTDFPLAVNYPPNHFFRGDPGGPRWDLGLNEVLWCSVIAVLFLVLGRKARAPGFFVMLWCLLYAPVRFGFDFLRNTDLASADTRWSGLTPAQWGCIVMFGIGVALVPRVRRASA